MITLEYIDENRTDTFKKGDKVIMVDCGEAGHYPNKVWECMTDSFTSPSSNDLVFLEGFSGSFSCRYLNQHNA